LETIKVLKKKILPIKSFQKSSSELYGSTIALKPGATHQVLQKKVKSASAFCAHFCLKVTQ
jgi:hypothetical protein